MIRNTALRCLTLLISLSAISFWLVASADLDRDWKLYAFMLALVVYSLLTIPVARTFIIAIKRPERLGHRYPSGGDL